MSTRKGHNQATRVVQEQLARERRRRRTVLTTAIAVAVLLVAGLVGWGVQATQRHDTQAALTTPSAAVDGGTGFAVGTGPVKIDVYEDFLCPACGQFEKTSAPTLKQLATAGKVTVVYHPIAILDHLSSTEYSTRAAAAAAAAGQGGRFAEYHDALYARQPAEGSAGLSDEQLIEIGGSVGLTDAAFAASVRAGTYRSWVTKVTETASSRGVTGTPTVLVAGRQLDAPSPQTLTTAVAAAAT
jgi:protein-disulfide isomerase